MKNLSFLIVVLVALGFSMVLAAEGEEMVGYLLDSACGNKIASNLAKLQEHTVACALKKPCQESGYGLILDGTFMKFEEAGDKKALAFLQSTDMKSHVKVKVTGYFVPWPQEFSPSLTGMVMVESIEAAGM